MNRYFVSLFASRNWRATVLAGALFVVAVVTPAPAQAPQAAASGGVVTSSGSVTLTRQPNVLRMTMEVSGQGKDVAEALAKLKSERESVAAKLKALGADDASVKFDATRVGGAGSASRQRAMQMMRNRGGGNRGAATKPDAQPKVELSVRVTAEWPFEAGTSPEEVIANGYALREKVKAGGLSKASSKATLTPEEQEELEEAAALAADDFGMPQAAAPGEPVFAFVRKVPVAERDAATAEAFKKAKDEASRLAAASGSQLGEVRQVGRQVAVVDADGDMGADYNGYAYQAQMMRQLGVNVPGTEVEEATGLEPGPVALQVVVKAAFAIK